MSEHEQQVAVINWFRLQYPQYTHNLFAIPNGSVLGGKNKWGQINKLKKEGFKPGVSDLFLALPIGDKSGLWVEMKDTGKTLCSVSKDQMEHLELMKESGYEAIWCAGADIAIAAIKTYMGEK